jgi:hypothetical protein
LVFEHALDTTCCAGSANFTSIVLVFSSSCGGCVIFLALLVGINDIRYGLSVFLDESQEFLISVNHFVLDSLWNRLSLLPGFEDLAHELTSLLVLELAL